MVDLVPTQKDPLRVIEFLWPHVHLYDKEREIVQSTWANDETYVPAANTMGKDFVAGYIIPVFFLTRQPCRIVTTSVKADHLDVLWGEIHRAIDTCKYPLSINDGGPLEILQKELRKVVDGKLCKISYVKGMVADDKHMDAMQGHYATPLGIDVPLGSEMCSPLKGFSDEIPRTLFVVDEAAGVRNGYYDMATSWAKRMLVFGNCNPCNNFFRQKIKNGDVRSKNGKRYYVKVIRIKAEDSPNVKLALAEQAVGKEISYRTLIPGVLSADDYFKRREVWDKVRQCIGLDGEFYEGAEQLLYPPEWLNNAEQLALKPKAKGRKFVLGIDTAFGGDASVWVVLSDWGVEELISIQTPDTSVIVGRTLALMKKYGIAAKDVLFDAGGGGAVHADLLRAKGYRVRAIAFGASATAEKKRGIHTLEQRKEDDIIRYAYKNRRAEMYGLLSRKLDPDDGGGMAIGKEHEELRRQLSPIPRKTDGEGRLYLPPKKKKDKDSTEETMTELIGCSPDEADALVLAIFGLEKKSSRVKVGAIL